MISDPNSLIVRGALQNVSIAFRNLDFVADELFPIIDGVHKQAKVAKYVKGAWFRDEAQVRAPGGVAPVLEFRMGTENLDPVNFAAATMVTDETRAASNEPGALPIQPDMDAVEFIANALDLKREVRASAILHATNWGGSGAGGADAGGHWGDGTVADDTFLADMKTGRAAIRALTGMLPNSLFLDYPAWDDLQMAPALLALMNPQKIDKQALVTVEALMVLAGVKNIIIGSAIKNTDEETVADTSFTGVDIWGTTGAETKGVGFLYYKPDRPGLKTPSAGYQYRLKKINGQGRLSTTWRENARHSDMYDTEEDVDIAPVSIDLGYMWKSTAVA